MNQKEERLCRAIQRAGIRASKKEGHLLTRDELLQVKVQVMPTWIRFIIGTGGLWCGFKAVKLFLLGSIGGGLLMGILSLLLISFAIWGIRRTCQTALEGMDCATSSDLLSVAVEGVANAVGAIFEAF